MELARERRLPQSHEVDELSSCADVFIRFIHLRINDHAELFFLATEDVRKAATGAYLLKKSPLSSIPQPSIAGPLERTIQIWKKRTTEIWNNNNLWL